MMADAYGKLTGRPGIAFATRGPGATNASAGVHVAFQDSTPMILLLGHDRESCTAVIKAYEAVTGVEARVGPKHRPNQEK